MQFDDILTRIGQFGRYQKMAFLVHGAAIAMCAWQAVLIVFIGAPTAFKCWSNANESAWTYDCNDSSIREGCSELMYDRSEFVSTIRSEWHLVCDRDYLVALVQTVFMAGWLVGVTVTGYFSDRYGRRRSLIFCTFVMIGSSAAAAFAPNYAVFTAFRFVAGFMAGGDVTMSVVAMIEMTGLKWRSFVGMGLGVMFGAGVASSAGLAYGLLDHRHLQLVVSLVPIVILVAFIFMFESPRWLLCANRKCEAEVILRKMAWFNGRDCDFDIMSPIFEEDTDHEVSSPVNLLDLVRTPNLRRVTCVICFNWSVISLVYYGITLSGASLGSNIFLNLFLSGLVEMPGCFVGYFAIRWLGRVKLVAALNIIGGLCCLAGSTLIGNADLNWLLVTLALCGKCAISASFAVIYIYTCEVYPTVMRNIGLGTSSMCARIGGLLAPQIARMGYAWSLLPFMVFAILSIAAGLLILLTPETRGQTLPETLSQGEAFAKIRTLKWCQKRTAKLEVPETLRSLTQANLSE